MNDPNIDIQYFADDEITLKELILKVIEFWKYLWGNKVKIVLSSLLFGCIWFLWKGQGETNYTSAVIFLVSEDQVNESMGSLNQRTARLMMQEANNKITELARSGKIIHKVLLTKSTINNRHDFLANHIIDIYGFHERWNKPPKVSQGASLNLSQFLFTRDNISDFSSKELRALRLIHQVISGNNLTRRKGLMNVAYSVDTDLFNLQVKAKNSELVAELMDKIYAELRKFYVSETVGRPQKMYDQLKAESDSLNTLLTTKTRTLASESDRNQNVFGSLGKLNIKSLQREINRIETEYDNTYRQLKSVETVLTKDTPEFIEIDRTFFPIEDAPSKIKSILIGLFLGGFLSSSFLIARKTIQDALNS